MLTPQFIFTAAFFGITIALAIMSLIMIISVLVNKYTPAIFDIIFLWVLAAALIMVTVEIHSIINGSSVLLSMN